MSAAVPGAGPGGGAATAARGRAGPRRPLGPGRCPPRSGPVSAALGGPGQIGLLPPRRPGEWAAPGRDRLPRGLCVEAVGGRGETRTGVPLVGSAFCPGVRQIDVRGSRMNVGFTSAGPGWGGCTAAPGRRGAGCRGGGGGGHRAALACCLKPSSLLCPPLRGAAGGVGPALPPAALPVSSSEASSYYCYYSCS